MARGSRGLGFVVICCMHLSVIAFASSVAGLHHYIQSRPLVLADFNQLGPGIQRFFKPVIVANLVVAVLHTLGLLVTLYDVGRLCCLRVHKISPGETPHARASLGILRWAQDAWRRWCEFLEPYALELTECRVLIEVTLQTYQAEKMSRLVASVWLNRLMAFVIVLNCWFTPATLFLFRRSSNTFRKFVRLSIDTVLDQVYGAGIPLLVFAPYLQDFRPATQSFPYEFYCMDAWTAVAVSELSQIFVISWTDFVSKTLPEFSLVYRLHILRSILRPPPVVVTETKDQVIGARQSRRCSRRLLHWALNFVLVAWGFLVLGVHLRASWTATRGATPGCMRELRRWGSDAYTCAVLEISCAQRAIAGHREDIADVLDHVDPKYVQVLVLSHCAELEVPPIVGSLRSLQVLKLYNSTVRSWEADAALTETGTPTLRQFFAVRTNFSDDLPLGLQSSDFPRALHSIMLVHTNLTTLPESLHDAWHTVDFLLLELSPSIREIPATLASFPALMWLSLCSNGIRHLRPEFLASLSLGELSLMDNPIAELPEFNGTWGVLRSLPMRGANVSAIPASWHAPHPGALATSLQIEAPGSPLCQRLEGGDSGDDDHGGSDDRTYPLGFVTVVCEDWWGIGYTYPLELEDTWRMTNRS